MTHAELSEADFHARLHHQNGCSKIFTQWRWHHLFVCLSVCSTWTVNKDVYILFTDEKTLVTTPKNRQNDRLFISQEQRRNKTPAHTINVQSLSNKWLTLHQFDTCRSRSQR